MTRGRRRRLAVQGLALIVGIVAAGCRHGLPVRRVDPAIDPRESAKASNTGPRTPVADAPSPNVVVDRGVPLPPLPLRPISDREALGAPAETPLLDAALVQARASQDAVIRAVAAPSVADVPALAVPPGTDEAARREPAPSARREPAPSASPQTPGPAINADKPHGPPPTAPAPVSDTPAGQDTPLDAAGTAHEDVTAIAEAIESEPTPQETAPREGGNGDDPKSVPGPLTWDEGIAQMKTIAHEKVEASSEQAPAWALRERLLADMADASEHDGGDAGDNRLFNAVAAALETASAGEASAGVSGAPADLRAVAVAIESKAPLEIVDLQFCRKVSGFGNYKALPNRSLRPGQTLIVYCEMAGVQYEPAESGFHSRLESQVEIVARPDTPPVWKQALGHADDTCAHRRRDYYVNYRITLPASLKKGSYEFRLVQKDLLAGSTVSRSIPITIQ